MIVETSYPDELLALARVSGHLTPRLLAGELDKLQRDVPVYVYGAKPRHFTRIQRQIRALGRRQVRLLSSPRVLTF